MVYKILLVDDEPDILEILSHTHLNLVDYKIYKANNGLEAIRIAEKIIPDLIIMDVNDA